MKAEFPTWLLHCTQPNQSNASRFVGKIVSMPRYTVRFGKTGPVSPKRSHCLGRSTSGQTLNGEFCRSRPTEICTHSNHSQTPLEFIMAARVLLLMTLTGLFAAAWNSDCPKAADSLQAFTKLLPHSKTDFGEHGKEWMVSEISQSITISQEFDTSAIVLPALIASGTYRVVDAEGRVGWLTIPVDDQATSQTDESKPFYHSHSESGCWYFIRVPAAPLIAAPQTDDAVLR